MSRNLLLLLLFSLLIVAHSGIFQDLFKIFRKKSKTDKSNQLTNTDENMIEDLQIENKILKDDILLLRKLILSQKRSLIDTKNKLNQSIKHTNEIELITKQKLQKFQDQIVKEHQIEINKLQSDYNSKLDNIIKTNNATHQLELNAIKEQLNKQIETNNININNSYREKEALQLQIKEKIVLLNKSLANEEALKKVSATHIKVSIYIT